MFPVWVYLVVALAIAGVAFILGQLVPGLGVPFVVLATAMWVAYAVRCGKLTRSRS